uniref:Uncharacterized protein n=1 Tax=viral metagenome TaxID=1070528 RepID=A0A6C0M1Y2_9ZZZZ
MDQAEEKFNPDVLINYEEKLKSLPTKFDPSKVVWKGITAGEEVIIDKPSEEEVKSRFDDELNKRAKEKKFIKRKNHAKLDPLEVQDTENTSNDFGGLKKIIIQDNDRLLKEKETYNRLLDDLQQLL